MANVDAVLWDFGGVFTASPFDGMSTYAEELGVDGLTVRELVFGAYHTDSDHPWHRLERGEVAMVDALAEISRLATEAGVALDTGRLFSFMGGHDGPARAERSLATLRAATAAGVRHAIITNNFREVADSWRKMIDIELFELVVDSSEVGVRKPDPRIYLLALERLGLTDPSRTVFIDDMESNVAAARALGMHGVVAGPDIHAALDELDAVIGL